MRRTIVPVLLIVAAALIFAACGDDGSKQDRPGNGADVAFIDGMMPHHESAIEMARVAGSRAESDFVKDLAQRIIDAQEREIGLLESVEKTLIDIEPRDLGVPDHQMGMDTDPQSLRDAQPFDRAFIDAMIPHHEGAIAMAQAEVDRGENPRLLALARDIIGAQSEEIKQMREHRIEVYGSAGPSGASGSTGESPGTGEGHPPAHMN